MANILRTITLTSDPGSAGPLYDVYYSTDCINYTICTDGSSVSLPTVGSTANVTFPDTTICIKLINLSSGCGANFVIETLSNIIFDYLVVAGGGGGGTGTGGGGGAGGLKSGSFYPASETLNVVVGLGGAIGVNGQTSSISSSFNGLISTLGGGFGGYGSTLSPYGTGSIGGSGGGGTGGVNETTISGSLGTIGQGFNGGTGVQTQGTSQCAGGGGGALKSGSSGTPGNTGTAGNGGSGSQWLDGNYYAGGGGGWYSGNGDKAGIGGIGGGGRGAAELEAIAVTGSANTGGGGGGGQLTGTYIAKAGGSGVVKLRYPSAFSASISAGLTASTVTTGSYKITSFTSGSGTVTFS